MTEAVDHNLSLLAERYNVTSADAAVITAGLRPNPVVTVNAMLPETALVDTGIATREAVVRTDYVLERGDKRERRIEQARLARTVAELQLLDTTRKLVLDVEGAYAEVQLAKLNLALAQENLDAFRNVVVNARAFSRNSSSNLLDDVWQSGRGVRAGRSGRC